MVNPTCGRQSLLLSKSKEQGDRQRICCSPRVFLMPCKLVLAYLHTSSVAKAKWGVLISCSPHFMQACACILAHKLSSKSEMGRVDFILCVQSLTSCDLKTRLQSCFQLTHLSHTSWTTQVLYPFCQRVVTKAIQPHCLPATHLYFSIPPPNSHRDFAFREMPDPLCPHNC
jgi:hypothetical protein